MMYINFSQTKYWRWKSWLRFVNASVVKTHSGVIKYQRSNTPRVKRIQKSYTVSHNPLVANYIAMH